MTLRLLPALLLAAIFALTTTPARASHDAVQFGSNITVPAGQTVHDAVCFFCSVQDEGTVDGDIVVFFGNVHISGEAHHDVVNFFGSVRADDNSSIRHDMVSFFGVVRLGEKRFGRQRPRGHVRRIARCRFRQRRRRPGRTGGVDLLVSDVDSGLDHHRRGSRDSGLSPPSVSGRLWDGPAHASIAAAAPTLSVEPG